MFKEIVAKMAEINSISDFNAVCDMVDEAYRDTAITSAENVILYSILRKLNIQ